MAATLAEGRIVAAAMNDPELSQALAAGQVKPLAKGYDAISKLFMQTAWFATQDWLAKNKETAKRFSDAIVAGGLWGMANNERAVTILAKYTNSNELKAKMRYATKLDPALIQPVLDAAFKYKLLPGQTTAADFSWDGK
jgi:ABC-type nitrate/sulfonate/bicarbonate transport system substrate-binding protein